MKQKMVIVLLVVAIAAGLSLTVYTAMHIHTHKPEEGTTSPVVTNEDTSPVVEAEGSQSEELNASPDLNTDEKPTAETIGDFYDRPPEKKMHDITPQEAEQYEREARAYFREYQFMEGADYLQQVVSETPQDGNAQKLHELFFAASLLANLPDVDDESAEHLDLEGIKNILSNVRDPELLFLGVMKLDPLNRAEVIFNKDSLNPVYDAKEIPHILNIDTEEEGLLEEIHILYPNVQTLHRVFFEIEGNQLYAYIMEYPDDRLVFHSIHNLPGKTTPYKTISEWEKILEAIRE